MPFCTNCGSQLPPNSKFCPGCGTKVPTTAVAEKAAHYSSANRSPDDLLAPSKSNQNQGSLTGTTQAVRSYIASASEEEKEKKYGQQKWGLFETDYQRRKGITTEESLQEIEDFANNGVTVKVGGPQASSSSSAASYHTASTGSTPSGGYASETYGVSRTGTTQGFSQANMNEVNGRGGFGGAGGAAGGFGSTSGGGRGQGTGTFGNGGDCDAGARFFMQHQENEARKFKPGYKGQPYK